MYTTVHVTSREGLEEQLGIPLDVEADAIEGVGLPFHAGAKVWYQAQGLKVD